MEWYDFAVYGYFATIIGQLFFPATDPSVSLIASFGAFAAGFLVRPLGGLIFGRIGDKFGRQNAMTLSVLAMAIPTVLMGLMPTYEKIGIWAPILLILLRIIQGMSVGGEYTSSLIFLVENAPKHRRSFTAVWGIWGATAGILLGSGVGLLITKLISEAELIEWGWRLPFAIGGMVAFLGWWIRNGIDIEPQQEKSDSPVKDVFRLHKKDVLVIAGLNIGVSVSFYTAFVYTVSYIRNIDMLSESLALEVNTLSMLLMLVVLPFAAWISDIYGRRKVLIFSLSLLVLSSVPVFSLMHSHSAMHIMIGEMLFAIIVGFTSGSVVALNVEMIHPSVRCTGLAFSYNAATGFFGGTTPLIATWLVTYTMDPIAPAYWLLVATTLSLATLLIWAKEIKYEHH